VPEPSSASALRDALDELHRKARSAWPALDVDAEVLRRALVARLEGAGDPLTSLAGLNGDEIYLALACAAGDRAALGVFESTYLPSIGDALRRMGFAPAVVDEALQRTRTRLLVASAGRAPRILDFGGRGRLLRWLRVVASRVAYTVARPVHAHVPLEESLPADESGDIELAFLKKTYGATFRSAFREALATLPVADRLLLKQKLTQNLTVVELGRLYGVHGSNVSRRVTDARRRLVEETRAAMMRRLQLDAPALSSVLRLIHSEVEISLSTYSEADLRELSG
jgi:RNA polymerase sigma-70 factor (ECF subfamily)